MKIYLDISKFITMEHLTVVEEDKPYQYSLSYLTNGIPVYSPPDNKYGNIKNVSSLEEVLFLPHPNKIFEEHGDLFYGYRFVFYNHNNYKVTDIEDNSIGIIRMDMNYFIQRVRFFTTSDETIVIDRICDPLFPAQQHMIECTVGRLEQVLTGTLEGIMTVYCSYYMNAKI